MSRLLLITSPRFLTDEILAGDPKPLKRRRLVPYQSHWNWIDLARSLDGRRGDR